MKKRWILLAGLSTLVFGCASAPDELVSRGPGLLAHDTDLHGLIDVSANRKLVKTVLSPINPTLGSFFSNWTRSVVLGISGDLKPRILVVAFGAYPRGIVYNQMDRQKGWRRENDLFIMNEGDQVLTMPESYMLVTGPRKSIEEFLRRYGAGGKAASSVTVDEAAFLESHDLAFLMSGRGTGLDKLLGASGFTLPIRSGRLYADRGRRGYEVQGALDAANDGAARALSGLLRLTLKTRLRNVLSPAQLGQIRVIPEGSRIRISGLTVTSEQLAKLIPLGVPEDD